MDSAAYTCLSYTWGNQTQTYPIQMNDCVMEVGRNLLEFLERAVLCCANQNLWIDALCIDQNDEDDKNLQVQRMGDIYKNATGVAVWLGNQDRIEFLFQQIEDAVLRKTGLANPDPELTGLHFANLDPEFTGLHFANRTDLLEICSTELAGHIYWNRAWIIQELLLAQNLTLLCGAAKTTRASLEAILHHCRQNPRVRKIYLLLQGVFHRQRTVPFWFIFYQRGHELSCYNPRDRIYSLLSITGEHSLKVTYSEPIIDTFWRAADHYSAWRCPRLITLLWSALGITRNMVENSAVERGRQLRVSIPMRPARIARGGNLRTQCRPRGCFVGRARIKSRSDLVLCPSTNISPLGVRAGDDDESSKEWWPGFDQENIHVAVRALQSKSQSTFSLALDTHHFGSMACPKDTELWFVDGGTERRVITWEDVSRLACLCRDVGEDKDAWRLRPHFVLRMNHRYPLVCVDFMLSQGEHAIRKSLERLERQLTFFRTSTTGLLSSSSGFGNITA